MNKLLGVGAAAGAASVTTAGVFYIKSGEKEATIKQELQKLNKKILTSKSDTRWDIKAHIYGTSITNNPKLKIDDKNTITKEELSTWCSTTLEKTNSEDLYNKAKAWCLTPSVKDKLSKESKQILASLTTKLSEYKGHSNNEDLNIPTSEIGNKEKTNLQESELKTWCNTYSEVELEDGTDKNYNRIVKWCTS
ncbi:hypothetical protein HF1_01820 [Mycoplasma haemofelis str. Langford 1]|uniref:Uncharacterized protein n=2 Tax=Mycoplasma haemofelis TaxID=29501 RepID=F6FGB9_MYCHI|nr:hypothetical protein [Mycoplasma haemofelis]AEG72509.1 hypothetical protein MHF_0210 [Mycoplasma haemofelis Ohio2]CBY92190.1 hypothetical protein HF1_01820 [Mycoplasma haemofelis str. Langford 1]